MPRPKSAPGETVNKGGRPRLHAEDSPSRARRLPQELVMRIEAAARYEKLTWAELVERLVAPGLVPIERAMLSDHAARLGLKLVG